MFEPEFGTHLFYEDSSPSPSLWLETLSLESIKLQGLGLKVRVATQVFCMGKIHGNIITNNLYKKFINKINTVFFVLILNLSLIKLFEI